ncbi:MAG: 16S rRNA (cytosine(967)-C(5))-methyltransferase RsmB, partial [Defluviitaleaceae bacterium]|nr:16S rRNA (cytosine(967)-C(5))-methyltransferase RsmB [Defluviitaleaceae bacterium]
YPEGLASSLVRWLGEDGAESFARHSHTPPAIPIYTNTTKTTPTALEKSLQAQGVECTPLEGGFFIVRNTGDITALRAFEEGAFFVMDPGAMWVVHALGLEPGHVFLDLCAAPGGKAFAAACVMGDAGEIIATDIHPHRVALMEKAAKRLGLKSIKTMAQDALAPIGLPLADAVLLDVPCSGLGTLRKRPEIKHKYKGANTALLDTQRDLLSAAAKRVKPGGVLVYATCTVAREENMEMVQGFCRAHPGFAVEPLPFLPPANLPHFMQENCLQLLPGLHNDGFFIARIRQIFP